MDINIIEEKTKAFLIDELEIEEEKILHDSRLKEDLGIDSLEIVDVMAFVDKEFGFKMKSEDFRDIKRIDQFCGFISERLQA